MRGTQKSSRITCAPDVDLCCPVKITKTPSTNWRCPPRFEVNSEWQVVSGEESKEIKSQVSNPLAPTQERTPNDQNTLIVPLVPVEDAQVTAAISAMASVLSKSCRDHNLIDHDMLIRILSNPKVLQQLATTSLGGSSSGTEYVLPDMKLQPKNIAVNRGAPAPAPAPPNPYRLVKDISYYRSLIQQHGGGGGGGGVAPPQTFGNGVVGINVGFRKLRDEQKPRMIKPCIYFNTPRGCRNGANCSYKHDFLSSQQNTSSVIEVQKAKRVKLNR